MAASPHVLVQNGSGSYVNPDSPGDPSYPGGVNVTPGNTISIKLASADSVGQWNLKVIGTDEETVQPILVGVDHSTGIVSTASTIVTFSVPSSVVGRAYIFRSIVNNGGPAYTVTFGIYTLTEGGFRVGAVGERLENDPLFGWTRTLNQFIKRGGGGGGGGGVPTSRRVIAGTGIIGGGDLTADRTFSADFGVETGKIAQGNDPRLSNDRTASGLRTTTSVVSISEATAPSSGQVLTASSGTLATWVTPSTGAPLASTTPADVTKSTASVGVGTTAARSDHKHDVSTATAGAATPGDSAAEGAATSLARSDHKHSLPSYGTTAGTLCQGNDSRLSDDRTASGLRTATTIVSISGATAPTSGQVLTAIDSTHAQWGSGGFTAGGDLTGSAISQTVVGVEGVPIKEVLYTSPSIQLSPGSAVVSDDTNLWITSSNLGLLIKVNPTDWGSPLSLIHTSTPSATFYISILKKYGNYLLGFDLFSNYVVVFDLLTEKLVGWVEAPTDCTSACVDTSDRLWVPYDGNVGDPSEVTYIPMSQVRAAFPSAAPVGTRVAIAGGSLGNLNVLHFGTDGNIWAAKAETLVRINPNTLSTGSTSPTDWFSVIDIISTTGNIWVLGLKSTGGTSELSYLFQYMNFDFPTSPISSTPICWNASGTGFEPYATGMSASSSAIYVSDDHKHVTAVNIITKALTIASGPNASSEGWMESWYSQVAVLGTKVWVSVGDNPILSEHGFTSFNVGDTTISSPITGFTEHAVTNLDLNTPDPYPYRVRAGDVLTAFSESGAPHKIVPLDYYTFMVVRKSSVVHVVISELASDQYTSTSINLNDTGGTLDLNKLEIFNGAYDGTRYAWFIGTYQDTTTSYYLWKVDTTLVSPVVAYPLAMTLPSSISQLLSIGYTNNLVMVGVLDNDESRARVLCINPSTGVIDTVVTHPKLGFTPEVNIEAHTQDFIWYGGAFSEGGSSTGMLTRYNPSLTVHKVNDLVNIVTVPVATDLASLNLLLNDLKSKINLHLVQSGVHLIPDSGNLFTTPDATDVGSPYTTATTLANQLKVTLLAHTQEPGWIYSGLTIIGIHYYMDVLSNVTASWVTDDTDLPGLITLANDIRSVYASHRTRLKCPVHNVADTVNFSTVGYSPNFPEAATLLNELRDKFNAHRTQLDVHNVDDLVNIVSGDATLDAPYSGPSYPNSYALAISLKAKFNAHLGTIEVHLVNSTNSLVTFDDPTDDTDLAGIIGLINTLGGYGYLSTNPYPGAYNFHLVQGSNYIDTPLNPAVELGNIAAIKQYYIGGDTWLMVAENSSTSQIYFNIIEGQFSPTSYYAPGTQVGSWNLGSLTGAPTNALDLAIDTNAGVFWLLTGGPNEATNPYKVHSISGLGGIPSPLINLSQNLSSDGPSCITSINQGPPKIAFRQGDYVGSLNSSGIIPPTAIYPMGGALKLGPLSHLAGVPVSPITDLGSNQGKALILSGGKLQLESITPLPLSNVRYLDKGTLIPQAKQNGSVNYPYSTIPQATSAVGALNYASPTLYVTPGYYTGTFRWLPTGSPLASLKLQGLSPDPSATSLPFIIVSGGSNNTIDSVTLRSGINTTLATTLKNTVLGGTFKGAGLQAQNSQFNSTIYGIGLYFTNCTFQTGVSLFTAYLEGSNSDLEVDTTTNNTLRIRVTSTSAFTVITVTSGASTSKSQIVSDLSAVVTSMGLSVESTSSNQIRIWGSTGYIEVDTLVNGSTLNTVIEWTALSVVGSTVQMDSISYWNFKSSSCVYGGSITLAAPPTHTRYLPLIAGIQSAGTTYTLLGVLPATDYYNLGFGVPTFTFDAIINVPTDSTAQVRLYDKTNSVSLYESSIISGLQTELSVGGVVTPAVGATILEFWLATPTATGGNASCISSGITITFS